MHLELKILQVYKNNYYHFTNNFEYNYARHNKYFLTPLHKYSTRVKYFCEVKNMFNFFLGLIVGANLGVLILGVINANKSIK